MPELVHYTPCSLLYKLHWTYTPSTGGRDWFRAGLSEGWGLEGFNCYFGSIEIPPVSSYSSQSGNWIPPIPPNPSPLAVLPWINPSLQWRECKFCVAYIIGFMEWNGARAPSFLNLKRKFGKVRESHSLWWVLKWPLRHTTGLSMWCCCQHERQRWLHTVEQAD